MNLVPVGKSTPLESKRPEPNQPIHKNISPSSQAMVRLLVGFIDPGDNRDILDSIYRVGTARPITCPPAKTGGQKGGLLTHCLPLAGGILLPCAAAKTEQKDGGEHGNLQRQGQPGTDGSAFEDEAEVPGTGHENQP